MTMTWQDKAEELRQRGYLLEIYALSKDDDNRWLAKVADCGGRHAMTIEAAIEQVYEWARTEWERDDMQEKEYMSRKGGEIVYENVAIWDKSLTFLHRTNNYGYVYDSITIMSEEFKYKCAKCDKKFDAKPTHGDKITCSKCDASYQFFGAGHARVKDDTRREVEKVLGL
jgi:hypothetical protein